MFPAFPYHEYDFCEQPCVYIYIFALPHNYFLNIKAKPKVIGSNTSAMSVNVLSTLNV